MLLTKHLVKELLDSLHGKVNRRSGIAKIFQEIRCKYFYSGIAKLVRKWVQGCEICIKDKRISNASLTPERPLSPKDAKQIDIFLLTQSASNTARGRIDIMAKHTYLPTTLITDKETDFTSRLVAEIAQIQVYISIVQRLYTRILLRN